MEIIFTGRIPYSKGLELMEACHKKVVENSNHPGYLLVLEHPPTITMGNRELLNDMKMQPEELKFKGIAYHKIDRGGSVTVHEPGQIVIYPIINIHFYKLGVRSFVCALEQSMIDTCNDYNIIATRDKLNPGVWVGESKIGAIGIRISNKVTKHGIAFNVINNLDTFQYIVPCGIRGKDVTTLKNCLKNNLPKMNDDEFFLHLQNKLAQKIKKSFLAV